MGITQNGGIPNLPLGLETVLPNSPTQVVMFYNLFVVFILMILAIASSQRDTRFMAILIPIWAGFSMFAGWLTFPNPGTGFGIIVVCAMLAIMTYMKETVHERFGIAGPGNTMIKIFTFLIVLQCVVVFVDQAKIFPDTVQPLAPSNPAYSTIDLSKEMGGLSGTGGLFAQIVDIASITLQMAVSALLVVVKCVISVALFAVVLAQVFPWILQAGMAGVAFLIMMQFAIWIMYLIFVFSIYYRPGPDPGW